MIGRHVVMWVWELPGRADRHDEAATVVTKITIVEAGG